MATVYILYSNSIDKHYIGSCFDIEERLNEHNTHFYTLAFTKRASDWEIY
jgi:putative endonuclease